MRNIQFNCVLYFALLISAAIAGYNVQAQPSEATAVVSSTQVSSATVATEIDPKVKIEQLQGKRKSLQEQIAAKQAAAKEVGDATAAAPIVRQVEMLQTIDLIQGQRISAYEQWISLNDQLKQAKEELEKLKETPQEGESSFLEYNRLREQLTVEEGRKDTITNRIELAQNSLKQAQSQLEQRTTQLAQIRAKSESAEEEAVRMQLASDMLASQYQIRAASETIQLRKIDQHNEESGREVYQAKLTLLQERVKRIEQNVVFSQEDLQDQKNRLAKEEFTLGQELDKAQKAKTKIQAKLDSANLRRTAAAASTPALDEEVNAKQFEIDTVNIRIESINSNLKWIPVRTSLWQKRFDVFNETVEETTMLEWKQEISTNIETLNQSSRSIGFSLEEKQSRITTIRNSLSNLSTEASDAKKWLEEQITFLDQSISLYRERQSQLESVRRLHNKLLDEINEKISQQTWDEYIHTLLEKEYYLNSARAWFYALTVGFIIFIICYLIRWVVTWRLRRLAKDSKSAVTPVASETVKRIKPLFFLVLAVYIASKMLILYEGYPTYMNRLFIIALIMQCAIITSYYLKQWILKYLLTKSKRDETSMSAMAIFNFIGQLSLWAITLILVIQNMGYDATGLVTGLGIGGIAIALAVQKVLGDLFASLSIVLDKPFVHGDFVIFDTFLGNIEHIGIKSTRIRSLTGEQIVCSNSDLLNARIRNFKRMHERRIVFALGVTYQTSAEQLEKIPGYIREIVESKDTVRFDRAHFKAYGDFSLNFETVYYVLSPDYPVYMDIQQDINLRLYRKFEQEGIEFAYPTQTVFVEKGDGGPDANWQPPSEPSQ
ncbi:MAG: mechanosensitive ion channel [Candidatus Hinthialibacter antarcticus]|nr:mechanosensitive ion channel [Candidatus Hinthialibacter antarcticus]